MYFFAVLCEYNATQDALLALASAQSGLEQWEQAVHTLQKVILYIFVQYHYSCTSLACSARRHCSVNLFLLIIITTFSNQAVVQQYARLDIGYHYTSDNLAVDDELVNLTLDDTHVHCCC
jgi:hypothetical protein